MILVPLPFVVALSLILLLCFVLAQEENGRSRVAVFLGACIVLMIVVGLRWSYAAPIFRFLQPVIAALLPPTAWLCFSVLVESRPKPAWPHFLPAVAVLALSASWPWLHPPLDAMLAVLFLGYGQALLRGGLAGPDFLPGARLGHALQTGMASAAAGGLLILSGMIDLAISLDFGIGGGTHAAEIVSVGNMIVLPLIAWATILIGRGTPPADMSSSEVRRTVPGDASPTDDDHVLARVERIMTERRLYRDADLTLERLSRRLGIPTRQISGAVNRSRGQNVSQFVNEWRIREAMDQLAATDRPITMIMFECGFQTKSNFNREFLRIAGKSPSEWRRKHAETPDDTVTQPVSPGSESR